jgi:ABC-type glutathione transport system ATPase component
MATPRTGNLVEIRGLVKHFEVQSEGAVRKRRALVHAINGVDLDVRAGQILALVGESGSGKTTLANCIAGFVTPTAGTIGFDGTPLVETRGGKVVRRATRRDMAQNIQMVFQDPSSALNPRQTVESTLVEPIRVHGLMSRQDAVARVTELLELSGIPASMRRRYPHELNSGQRQRLVIARSLTLSPRLLLADEPVSRLDVSMQSQILNLLLSLRE